MLSLEGESKGWSEGEVVTNSEVRIAEERRRSVAYELLLDMTVYENALHCTRYSFIPGNDAVNISLRETPSIKPNLPPALPSTKCVSAPPIT